ncbi:MAG: hypothetical protein RMK31_07810 [Candidatus Caldarchaeum sp.]|nr:hypothetical protein [Candidatus Caldarchaeum sp.]
MVMISLDLLEVVLLAVSVFFAILAVEQSKLVRSVMGLLGSTSTLGVISSLHLYPVALFQLIVSGGIVALFLSSSC